MTSSLSSSDSVSADMNSILPADEIKAVKSLQELRARCGLDRGVNRYQIADEQLFAFPKARKACIKILQETDNPELKADALNFLHDLFLFDPFTSESTAGGLMSTIKQLCHFLVNIEDEVPRIQEKCIRTFSSGLDCVLCHYEVGHIGAITEETRQKFIKAPDSLKRLYQGKNPIVEFYTAMAEEAGRKLTSDKSHKTSVLSGIIDFAKACQSTDEFNAQNAWKSFKTTIDSGRFQEEWYERTLLQAKVSKEIWRSPDLLKTFHEMVDICGLEGSKDPYVTNWRYLMGVIQSLSDIIIYSHDSSTQTLALRGTDEGKKVGLLNFINLQGIAMGRGGSKDISWKLRYGAASALVRIWLRGPNHLKDEVAKLMNELEANAPDESVRNLIASATNKDRLLQRTRKQQLEEEAKKLTDDFSKSSSAQTAEEQPLHIPDVLVKESPLPTLSNLSSAEASLDSNPVPLREEEPTKVEKITEPSEVTEKMFFRLYCPISGEPMWDAVRTPSGKVYGRKSIEKWLQTCERDPFTNEPLKENQLVAAEDISSEVATLFGAEKSPHFNLSPPGKRFYIPPQFRASSTQNENALNRKLFFACAQGNLSGLLQLIRQGADVNSSLDGEGFVLAKAYKEKRYAVLEALVSNDAYCSLKGLEGKIIWEQVVQEGDLKAVAAIALGIPKPKRKDLLEKKLSEAKAEIAEVLVKAWSSDPGFAQTLDIVKCAELNWPFTRQSLVPLISSDLLTGYLEQLAEVLGAGPLSELFQECELDSNFWQKVDLGRWAKLNTAFTTENLLPALPPNFRESALANIMESKDCDLFVECIKSWGNDSSLSMSSEIFDLISEQEEFFATYTNEVLQNGNLRDLALFSKGLTVIDFSEIDLSSHSFEDLKMFPKLKTLILKDTNPTDKHLEVIGGLQQLQALDLSLNSLDEFSLLNNDSSVFLIRRLNSFRGEEIFDALETAITDNGISHLRGLENLEYLNLRGHHQITDKGVKELKVLHKLRSLNLWGCKKITGRGLRPMLTEGYIKLRTLNLGFCKEIDKEVIFDMEKCPSLEKINLVRTKIKEGTYVFPEGLSDLKRLGNLQELKLLTFKVDRGVPISSICQLKKLRLFHVSCTSQFDMELSGLMKMFSGLTNLESLRVQNTHERDEGISKIKNLTKLRDLELKFYDRELTNTGLTHLEGMTNLERLCLYGKNDSGNLNLLSIQLEKLKKLTILDLRAAPIFRLSDRENDLLKLKTLKTLYLSKCDTQEMLLRLGELDSLENLWIGGWGAKDQVMEFGVLKNLRALCLGFSWTDIANDQLHSLGNLRNLRHLTLDFSSRYARKKETVDFSWLPEMKSLKSLHISMAPTFTDQVVSQLKGLKNLQALYLDRCEITDEGLPHLEQLENLRILKISKCKTSKEGTLNLKKKFPLLQEVIFSKESLFEKIVK